MIVVTGAAGQLGTAFRSLLPKARFLTRSDLDLAGPDPIAAKLAAFAPEAIINCAAYTNVDRAESEESLAYAVNADAVAAMARFAGESGIPFATFSTDFVFDGSATTPYVESSPPTPINAYGRTKLAGERLALAAHPGALVVRTSWVISGTHPNFVATMLRLVEERDLRVVDDQLGCPTVAGDLAAATLHALGEGATGVLHLTNSGATTWLELARTAVDMAGRDPSRIEPCTTADYPTPARRPRYSVLGSERREQLGIEPLPDWRVSLVAVVHEQMEPKAEPAS